MRRVTLALAVTAVFVLLTGVAAQIDLGTVLACVADLKNDGQPLGQAGPARVGGIAIPRGNGDPVITDGIFTPGEWDDAIRIPVAKTVTLHLKRLRDVVFVGVRGQGPIGIGPSELSIAVPGGPIRKLHVSAQLGEIVVPASGPEPRFRFGLTTEWYANELRRDMEEAARLEKQGKSPIEIIFATSYPSDGIEFAIRRSKFPGERWLLRLLASAMADDGKPGSTIYPSGAPERVTDGWLELHFPN
jgi:hypothetical protein